MEGEESVPDEQELHKAQLSDRRWLLIEIAMGTQSSILRGKIHVLGDMDGGHSLEIFSLFKTLLGIF